MGTFATLGGSPTGTPGALVAQRTWNDYALGRDDASPTSARLLVYTGVIANHRAGVEQTEEPDPVTQDLPNSNSSSGLSARTSRSRTARCARRRDDPSRTRPAKPRPAALMIDTADSLDPGPARRE